MSLTNLEPLRACLTRLNLALTVGPATKANGSCFICACKQNMDRLAAEGAWLQNIPDEEEFRQMVIAFMQRNREMWTRATYNECLNVYQNPKYDDSQFDELLSDQAKSNAWTDMNGTFVEAVSKLFNVEIHIILPSVNGPVLPSGEGGPYIILNRSLPGESKLIFYMGLLQDSSQYNGHYQYIEPTTGSTVGQQQKTPCVSPTKSPSKSPSPLKLRRGKLISKYLKSPTPRRLLKETHCFFCSESAGRTDLEAHLEKSIECARYYRRNYKVKSILAILVKEFPCLFCPATEKNWKISNHLKKNINCLNQYLKKFDVTSLKELQKKLELLRKQLRPSVLNRKLELEKAKIKNLEKEEKKTEVDLLNDFRRQCTFSNVLLCVECGANYCQQSRRIEEIEVDEGSQDEQIKMKTRFKKYHKCQDCTLPVSSPLIGFTRLENENQVLFVPLPSSQESDSSVPETNESNLNKNITFLLPCSIESLNFVEVKSSAKQNAGIVYKLGVGFAELFSTIYRTEILKYRNLKIFSDRYEGTIKIEEGSKTLTHTEKLISDSSVVGSDSWRRLNFLNLSHRLEQLGAVCIVVICEVPVHSEDILATIQIQLGKVITVEYVGDSSNEMKTQYYLHSDHEANTECSDHCNKVPLMDYLRDTGFDYELIKTKFLSAYMSSVQQKFNNVIKNFVKPTSSGLHAENYNFQLFFKPDNSVQIKGILWPKTLDDLNIQIGLNRTSFDGDLKKDLIKKVDQTILATCHVSSLRNILKITTSQAEKLSDLILSSQLHVCKSDHKCDFPQIPLLSTQVVEWSTNFVTCKEFNENIKRILRAIAGSELLLTTEEWLLKIFSSNYFVGEIIENKVIEVKTTVGRAFSFEIDDRLMEFIEVYLDKFRGFENSPLIACYHYSASTGSPTEVGGIIVQRPCLRDMYITDYNLTILKAMECNTEVKIKNGFDDVVASHFQCKSESLHWSTSLEIGEEISGTHQEVSAAEAFTLFDSKFTRSTTTNPVEFICASEKRKKFFKKVASPTEKSFQDKQSGKNFEPQLTNMDRFFQVPSNIKICLAEFVIFYEFCGADESKNLFKLFRHQGVEIQDSERKCAFSNASFLPEFICLQNEDVMKMRTNPKVISFPRFDVSSREQRYQEVLLFSPDAQETMTDTDVERLYWSKDDPPILDSNGDIMTIIHRMKR